MGRQPWIVNGIMRVEDAVSAGITPAQVGFSLFLFAVIYGLLVAVDVYLLMHHGRKGPKSARKNEAFARVDAAGMHPASSAA